MIPVAPYAGAWIEMPKVVSYMTKYMVAPYAGAWIEMGNDRFDFDYCFVAPYAGAWIEIYEGVDQMVDLDSRSLRGSVD